MIRSLVQRVWGRRPQGAIPTWVTASTLLMILTTCVVGFWDRLGELPSWRCAVYRPWSMRLDRVADLGIWVAYCWISLSGARLLLKTKVSRNYSVLIVLFGCFILGCGFTHKLKFWSGYFDLLGVAAWENFFTMIASLLAACVFDNSVNGVGGSGDAALGNNKLIEHMVAKVRGWMVVGLTLFVFLGLGVMAYTSIRSAVENSETRRKSYDAVLKLDKAVRVVADAQNGQRGYIITGQKSFLGEYEGAEADIARQLEGLARTESFPAPKLHRLQQLCVGLFAEMGHVIEVREQSASKAIELVQDQRGRRYMDEIKSETDDLRQHEKERITRLTALTQAGADTTMLLLPLAGGVAFIVIVVTMWIIQSSQQQSELAWLEKEAAWEAQRRAEDDLDQSRQQFYRLVDNVHDYGIFLLDPQGIIETWNTGAQRIKGYVPEEIIGKSFTVFYAHEQIADGVPFRALETARSTGQFHDENWRLRKGGTPFWASVSIVAIKDEHGDVVNFLKIVRDWTEKRNGELEIRKAEAFFRTTIDLAPNAVVIGDALGIIKVWNTQAEITFGYKQEEVIGKPVTTLMPERYRQEHHDGLMRTAASGKSSLARHPLELVGLRKDGSEFPLELTFDMLLVDGEINYISILRDVSERRQAEQALRGLNQQLKTVNADLVRSNAELDQFAAVASHDLKSPLRQVVSYVQLLNRRYAALLDEDGKQFIRYAVEGAARMQALINDLLIFSRAGSGEFKPKVVDMSKVVEVALRNLNGWLADSHAEINRPDVLPEVWGDEGSLIQVFENLFSNAVKFSTPGADPKIWVTVTPHGQGWQFAVKDDGIGMEPDHLDQIWTMFKQLNGTDYPGTGIGLSIVKKVVERHAGEISVESKPGQGSIFFITLPAAPK